MLGDYDIYNIYHSGSPEAVTVPLVCVLHKRAFLGHWYRLLTAGAYLGGWGRHLSL